MPQGTKYSPDEVYGIIKQVANQRGVNDVAKIATATAIVLRESGGDAKAYRPASQNPNGGNDRGWWQWNDKWHPDVSDVVAFDPVKSTEVAFTKSEGFTNWRPWFQRGELRFEGGNAQQAYKDAWFAATKSGDNDSSVASTVDDVVDKVVPWADSLAAILSRLVSPTFWKRVGIGVLGALIIVAGLILFFNIEPPVPAAKVAKAVT